jgi:hypothetical protein
MAAAVGAQEINDIRFIVPFSELKPSYESYRADDVTGRFRIYLYLNKSNTRLDQIRIDRLSDDTYIIINVDPDSQLNNINDNKYKRPTAIILNHPEAIEFEIQGLTSKIVSRVGSQCLIFDKIIVSNNSKEYSVEPAIDRILLYNEKGSMIGSKRIKPQKAITIDTSCHFLHSFVKEETFPSLAELSNALGDAAAAGAGAASIQARPGAGGKVRPGKVPKKSFPSLAELYNALGGKRRTRRRVAKKARKTRRRSH